MSDSELRRLIINGIFEASPEGILVVNDKNIILSHNRQFVAIWQIPGDLLHGLEQGTAIGLDDAGILSAILERVKDKQDFLARLKELYDNPNLKDVCEIELSDGRTLESNSTVLNSNDGQYLARLWFFRDITEYKKLEDARERIAAQEKYHTILKTATDGFWTVSKDGRLLEVNDAYCTMSGYSRNELLNMHIPDLEAKEAKEDTRQHIEKIIALGKDQFETRHQRKDGVIIDVEITTQFMPLVDQMFVVFVKDITRRKLVEAEIRHLNAVLEQRVEERTAQLSAEIRVREKSEQTLMRYAAIINSSDDAIIGKTLEGIITSWNGGAERMFGYSSEEAQGRHITFLFPEQYQHEEEMLLDRIRSGDFVKHYETVGRCKGDKLLDVSVSLSPIRDKDGNVLGASTIMRNITERKLLEDRVHQLAFHDELTKLPNRRVLYERLTLAMSASKRSGHYGAVMYLDLDNFKPLNDTHGHAFGDLLLVEAAERLKRCVREIDTVTRFGGDEFVVMLGDLSIDQADSISQVQIVAEKIRISLSNPYLLTFKQQGKADSTVEHHCTASIGVVLFFDHESSSDIVLQRADEAMYQAKEAGRNSIRFYEPKA